MRFLIDRCAGRLLADWLRAEGHDVVELRTLGPDPGDQEVLHLATEALRILLTIDTDFGDLIFRDQEHHCGLIRLPDVRPAERITAMRQVLDRHGVRLEAGAVVTVRGHRIRVSAGTGSGDPRDPS